MDWILIGQSSLGSWWLDPNNWLAMLKVAAGLGFVIFVHELGHFAVAKMCGVKCEKFYIGFDFFQLKIGKWTILPRALFKFKYGETEYGIGSFPLGGYVKMLGQDDNPRNMEQENERSRAGGESEGGKVKHDPRSYLAKSVPQRMAIISAGVVMNLIFAVIFATIAHKIGVSYTPCVVGDASPGGAAWRAGLGPGDKILRIDDGRTSEHLRWDWDMMNATITAGVGANMELLVRSEDGTEETVFLRPRASQSPGDSRPVLGVLGVRTTKLLDRLQTVPHTQADKVKELLKPNDNVVAVRPKSHSAPIPVKSHQEITRVFAQYPEEPLFITVERADPKAKSKDAKPERHEIEIEASPRLTLGLVMRRGPISGVRPGSPADQAGLKEGDVIRKFAGQPFGDPLTFPYRLAAFHGQPVKLEVERTNSSGRKETLQIDLVPEQPNSYFDGYGLGDDFSVDSLGIVYPVFQIVEQVVPGTPADKAGMQSGDVITYLQLIPTTKDRAEQNASFYTLVKRPYKLSLESPSWPFVDELLQDILPTTEVKLLYYRPPAGSTFADLKKLANEKGESREALLKPIESGRFEDSRGLIFAQLEEDPHPADSWAEAFGLGLRQTYEDGTKIIVILHKLVTFQLSPTNLGGITMITYVATNEASHGTARLLLFLTFLSANLAVVNFLPIPVLDGGHMMFLAWEGIFRRPVPERWQFQLTLGGLAFVLCLFLFTNGLDVYRFVVAPLMRWLG